MEQPSVGLLGIHLGDGLKPSFTNKMDSFVNHTLFISVNHPQFVAKWAKETLPLLSESDKEMVEEYIKKHYGIIKKVQSEK